MADLPIDLPGGLADRLLGAFDLEAKIPRALEALGPIGDRDVVLVDADRGARARQLVDLGARLTRVERPARFAAADQNERAALPPGERLSLGTPEALGLPDGSADVIVGMWTAYRAPSNAEIREADRVLRDGGRLLVVHDYGRDDVSRLRGNLPEYATWSRRDGWYLTNGFRIRVIHAFWTFDTLEAARSFLEDAFADVGLAVARTLKRPRLTYNVAVYHRTKGEATLDSRVPVAAQAG